MAKKKNSMALFEVIQKGRQGDMEVPGWMDSPEQTVQTAQAAGQAAPRPVRAPREALARMAGERVRFSLSYVQCAVAGLGLVALLAGAYGLGLWGGRVTSPQPDGRTLSERTQVAKHVAQGGPSGRTPPPPGGTQLRQDGKHYLVIQALAGVAQSDLDEATRIAEWCKERGEAATIARYTVPRSTKQRYIVWSLRAVDSPNSAEAAAYAQKIEAFGKEYFAKYKTYDFRQRTAAGKFEPWFETYDKPR